MCASWATSPPAVGAPQGFQRRAQPRITPRAWSAAATRPAGRAGKPPARGTSSKGSEWAIVRSSLRLRRTCSGRAESAAQLPNIRLLPDLGSDPERIARLALRGRDRGFQIARAASGVVSSLCAKDRETQGSVGPSRRAIRGRTSVPYKKRQRAAKVLLGLVHIVRPAAELEVLDNGRAAVRIRAHVVDSESRAQCSEPSRRRYRPPSSRSQTSRLTAAGNATLIQIRGLRLRARECCGQLRALLLASKQRQRTIEDRGGIAVPERECRKHTLDAELVVRFDDIVRCILTVQGREAATRKPSAKLPTSVHLCEGRNAVSKFVASRSRAVATFDLPASSAASDRNSRE